MATTGRGGHNKAAVREQWQDQDEHHTTVEVTVGTKLGRTSGGSYHKPISVYVVPSGGGPPVMHRTSRLIDQHRLRI